MAKGKWIALLLGMAMVCSFVGCSQKEEKEAVTAESSGHASVSKVTLTEGKYSDEKLDDTWDENDAVYLKLEDDSISVQAVGESGEDGIEVSGSTATISQAGTYVLSGSLADGQIIVDAEKDTYVKLVLNGAEITCTDSAPIYSKAGSLIVTLAENTENTITDGENYVFDGEGEDEPSAAVFAKDDLTFNGTGMLNVNGNYNNAIQCKDDLKFVAGTYVISAADDAIVGKDSVSIRDGNFTIESGDDGIKATNIEDPEKGYVLIENGTFQITAGGDGVQAETLLRVNDGKFDIVAGGGSGDAVMSGMMKEGDVPGRGGMGENRMSKDQEPPEGGEMPQDGDMPEGGEMLRDREMPQDGNMPEGGELPQDGIRPEGGELPQNGESQEGFGKGEDAPQKKGQNETISGQDEASGNEAVSGNNLLAEKWGVSDDESGEEVSTKALKSYVELVIAGGEFALDSGDDALHSNQNVSIDGGTFTIQAGDDGIHADKTLTVDGGSIDITQSYEGLEGFDVVINAGDIKVVASDDGVNAAGDDDSAANPESDSEEESEAVQSEDEESANTPQDQGQQVSKTSASKQNIGRKMDGFMAGEDQGATLTVNGGTLYVNAEGDGLDANGDITINGGTVTVHGPVSGGNGTLDYASSCKITGGVFVGVGSVGMAQNPSEDSSQPSIVGTLSQAAEAGTTISVKNSEGEVIASVVTEKNVQWYAISAPELKEGESYIVNVGDEEQTVRLSEVVTVIR